MSAQACELLPDFPALRGQLAGLQTIRPRGRVIEVIGTLVEASGPELPVGGLCTIESRDRRRRIEAEVVGFREDRILLMPLGEPGGIERGQYVVAGARHAEVPVGLSLLGRVLDGCGDPLDDLGPLHESARVRAEARAINPLARVPIREPLGLGVRSLDSLLTCGVGQRLGIFAGSGVGKSSLLGMIARESRADLNVIGLIGERGREVREFLERDLGPEGRSRSIVIAATSDQAPLLRVRGAFLASAIASWFRDRGANVMLMLDSITRLAMAQREIGLSIGEPPSSRGYTPSVFALMPRLIEQAGRTTAGSVTGLYTVLVEGDDMNEPIADTARGLLDGHIVLSRERAEEGQFPAVDPLQSVSRLMPDLVSEAHAECAMRVRSLLATWRDARDLVRIGAYQDGSDAAIDEAIRRREDIASFLRQGLTERITFGESVQSLHALFPGGSDS